MPRSMIARTFLLLPLVACGLAACTTAVDPIDPGDDNPVEPLTYDVGARFEPPAGRVVRGLGQWAEYNAKYAISRQARF